MRNLTNDNFFEQKNNYVAWLGLLVSVIIFVVSLGRFSDSESLGTFIIIGFLGILVSGCILVTNAGKGSQADESLKLLKDMNLYEQMRKEFPKHTEKRIYYVSDNFVYGFSWHICIPLKMIVEIQTNFVRYINGVGKDRECVILKLSNGETYKLFNYYGFDTGHVEEIKQCLYEILQHNPRIIINGKSVI